MTQHKTDQSCTLFY